MGWLQQEEYWYDTEQIGMYMTVEVNLQHKEERDLASRGVTFLIYESCKCFREA